MPSKDSFNCKIYLSEAEALHIAKRPSSLTAEKRVFAFVRAKPKNDERLERNLHNSGQLDSMKLLSRSKSES